jgi:hypothetical protein
VSHGSGKSAVRVAREASAGCGEMALVELPAIDLLTSLGWSFKNLYAETFGELGSKGRERESQVGLTRRLHAALVALNPCLPADAYAQAIERLAQDRSKQIAVNANRDFYRLLKDGVKVKVPDEHGGHNIETLRVIDWATPTNNEFFLASQTRVAGDMYRRRCDLLGFVNGLLLVFIELKKPAVPQTRPTDTPTSPTSVRSARREPTASCPGRARRSSASRRIRPHARSLGAMHRRLAGTVACQPVVPTPESPSSASASGHSAGK